MSETCEGCRYYSRKTVQSDEEIRFVSINIAPHIKPDYVEETCRRHPPVAVSCGWSQATTKAGGWCGEWAAKDAGRTCATEARSIFDAVTQMNELRKMMKGWGYGT